MNHFLSLVAAVELKVKTHAFSMEKNGLSVQGSSCCAYVTGGFLLGFTRKPGRFYFAIQLSQQKKSLWGSILQHLYSCKSLFHVNLRDSKIHVAVVFSWSDDWHQKVALHLLAQLVLEGCFSVPFCIKILPPSYYAILTCNLSFHRLHPKNML